MASRKLRFIAGNTSGTGSQSLYIKTFTNLTESNQRKDYYHKVYEVVSRIPYGRVTTYGSIASFLGVASGARMVGYALNQTIDSNLEIPAHRVLNRNGELTGRAYFPGDTMRERLQQEGVQFVDEYEVDLDQFFWDPANHLTLEEIEED